MAVLQQKTNAFYLDSHPGESAKQLSDIHLARLPTHVAQILSTVIWKNRYERTFGGPGLRQIATYLNLRTYAREHPCPNLYLPLQPHLRMVEWAERNRANYFWLVSYLEEMFKNYSERFEKLESHGTYRIFNYLREEAQSVTFRLGTFTVEPPAGFSTQSIAIGRQNPGPKSWIYVDPFDRLGDDHILIYDTGISDLRRAEIENQLYYASKKVDVCKWTCHPEENLMPSWFKEYHEANGRILKIEPSKKYKGKVEMSMIRA